MKIKVLVILTFTFYQHNIQAQPWEPHEKRNKASVYISKHKLSQPRSPSKIKNIEQVNGFVSMQVNTDINGLNVIGDAANEPSMAVNPLNPNQIAIGWRQFDTVTSDFRQAGRSYSSDGGKTWNYQEVFEPGVFRSDPVLESDADGVFFYQSLFVGKDNQGEYNFYRIDQWKSNDGGRNWVDKTFAYGGDKSWIAIDKTNKSTRGNIYAAWNIYLSPTYLETFNTSLNSGVSFTQPIEIPKSPIFGTLDVGPNGELYIIGFVDSDDQAPNDLGAQFLIKMEEPYKSQPNFSVATRIYMRGSLRIQSSINPAGLPGQLYVKVDSSNKASRGNVYLLGSLAPFVSGDKLDVMFMRSKDGGVTFSESIALGGDNSKNWQWFGSMSVAPNGRIDVIWYDTRNDDGSQGDIFSSRMYYTYSYDAGVTFSKEQYITPRFPNRIGYPIQEKMGDYIDIESDNLGAHIAYTATYNNEQDVYYMYAKPSAIEENPDFPTLLTNNAWAVDGVPSQGILSSTLINNGNPDNPLLAFEAIFTAKPDGTPIWLVATGEIPKFGDSYTIPLFMPTGDLSDQGQPLLAIGIMTKNRLRDDNGDLIDNKIEYVFDMSDAVKENLQATLGAKYSETFFMSNPFYNIQKTLTFNSLLPRTQVKKDLCNINGQVLTSQGEKSEGRLQYTYLREGILELFAADFTYKKTMENGVAVLETDANGFAIPTWEVIQANASGVQTNNSVTNKVSKPNGGLGFFEEGDETGITEIGTEQVVNNGPQLITTKPNTLVETMTVLANSAYCGEL